MGNVHKEARERGQQKYVLYSPGALVLNPNAELQAELFVPRLETAWDLAFDLSG